MEDKRRILEMVREGVLSPEEALELLAVLEDREEGRAEEGLTPPLVRLVAQGAEVRVVGEKGLASPRAEGGEFRQEGEGYLLRLGLREKGRLWVPEGSPVRLEAKGSNLELSRVALSGQAHGCNLEGEELLGLDLRLVAGNLEAGPSPQGRAPRAGPQGGQRRAPLPPRLGPPFGGRGPAFLAGGRGRLDPGAGRVPAWGRAGGPLGLGLSPATWKWRPRHGREKGACWRCCRRERSA
jgi:hypothetical protein